METEASIYSQGASGYKILHQIHHVMIIRISLVQLQKTSSAQNHWENEDGNLFLKNWHSDTSSDNSEKLISWLSNLIFWMSKCWQVTTQISTIVGFFHQFEELPSIDAMLDHHEKEKFYIYSDLYPFLGWLHPTKQPGEILKNPAYFCSIHFKTVTTYSSIYHSDAWWHSSKQLQNGQLVTRVALPLLKWILDCDVLKCPHYGIFVRFHKPFQTRLPVSFGQRPLPWLSQNHFRQNQTLHFMKCSYHRN